ncbi:MAG: hypothetical protein K2W95_30490 [Candidatus Obscuribacterales bacterium]|nr:hypothetical protein [Candidatus Obscuribacterales bacterium]
MNRILFAMLLGMAVATPAFAFDPALDSTADTGNYGNSSWRTTETNRDYNHQSGWGNIDFAGEGLSLPTSSQGAFSPNGPNLAGTPSGFFLGGPSGAASSAPVRGTMFAPGNLALRQMAKSTLPPTRLEGFVHNSGKSEAIYGDEGIYLPPFDSFTADHRIEAGINSPDLTTGHKSNAPSAWDFPQ